MVGVSRSIQVGHGRNRLFSVALVTGVFIVATDGQAVTVFVDQNSPPGGNGLSWPQAFDTVQDAIDAALMPGSSIDQIWVAQGTYFPTARTIPIDPISVTFKLVRDVKVFGGFPTGGGATGGFSERNPEAYPTVLTGDIPDNQRARHVVTAIAVGDLAELNGFTITRGFEDAGDGTATFGAGLYIRGGPLMMGNPGNSDPAIVNCVFIENEAAAAGGAVHISGAVGAGAHPRFIACKFIGNVAGGLAGAMCNDAGEVTFVNCLFSGNTAGSDGGAFFNSSNPQDSIAEFTNCTFSRNTSGDRGGGIFNGGTTKLHNCILWGNEDSTGVTEIAQVHDLGALGSSVTADYTCIQNLSVYAGNNNIGTDPLFIDDDGVDNVVGTIDDNLRLLSSSPSVDTGLDSSVPADSHDVDDDGDMMEATPAIDRGERIKVVVDRGAYEFRCLGDCVTSASFQPPPDGNVDGADLAVLLGSWSPGPCDFNCCSDIVTSATFQPPPDGIVDGADLSVLLGWWGSPCNDPGQGGGGEGLMGGGSGPAGASGTGPFDGTAFGILLQELLETGDPELAAFLAGLLQEWHQH